MMELMPSPTTPKQCVAPHAIRVSIMISAVVSSEENSGDGWGTMPAEVSESSEEFEARAWVAVAPALAATIPTPAI
jgi:hypothetical protein